ncbi:MAG: hypothetical protein KAW51_06550 [Candidatus Lokiarchaeota archaeon]|nr:hypothetical protein [Candidatus Lokiarchaeota archaeon]
MLLQNNKGISLLLLLCGVVVGLIAVVLLYVFNWSTIIETYQTHEGTLGIVLAIGTRIIIVSLMAIYTFYSWFKQEKQYFSDMPFLFGVFFLLLIFGKMLDLFIDFSYFQLDSGLLLLVMKARYFIAIFDLLPMMFLSIYMILISLSVKERFNKLSNEKYLNKIRLRILGIVIAIEIFVNIFILSVENAPIIYPITILPSLISIVWLFNFAWRNQRLSQVNTFILMIGFGLYLITSILRPLIQFIVGESPLFVITAESIDIIIFVIIFIGFYKKSNYPPNK